MRQSNWSKVQEEPNHSSSAMFFAELSEKERRKKDRKRKAQWKD
jgi:hypothetical protein